MNYSLIQFRLLQEGQTLFSKTYYQDIFERIPPNFNLIYYLMHQFSSQTFLSDPNSSLFLLH